MSDSGRHVGDCRHARSTDWCVDCLRKRVVALEAERDRLRGAAEKMLAYIETDPDANCHTHKLFWIRREARAALAGRGGE